MLLGEFRGTNLTIEKVYIDMNNKVTGNTANIGSYGGMIGHIITTSSVDIKLSRVVNINIQAGANAAFSTGGFIGGSGNSNVTIEESFVTGSIQGGSRGIGGMIGDINGTSLIIKDSYTAVDLKNHTGQTGSFTNAGGTITTVAGIGIFVGSNTGANVNITDTWGTSSANNTGLEDDGALTTSSTSVYSNIERNGGTGTPKGADEYDGAGTVLPAGFTTVYSTGNLIWKKVAGNFPYLARNVDKYLKRVVAFAPNPTEFKYANQTDGVGKTTVGAAVTTPTFTSTQTAFSGYDLLNTKINLFSTNAAYDPAKTILLIASDVTVPMGETAAKSIRSIETIANVAVGTGAAADRVGLTEFKIVKNTYTAGVEARMRKYDTLTLYGNYYGAPILTGVTGDTSISLPFGINAKGVYTHRDLAYMDNLQTLFGNGKTYTMKNDIIMDNTIIPVNELVDGTWRSTFDGGGKTISNYKITHGATNSATPSGFFGITGSGAGIKNFRLILGANISATQRYAGVIVGLVTRNLSIDNVHVDYNGKAWNANVTVANHGTLVGRVFSGSTTDALSVLTLNRVSADNVNMQTAGNTPEFGGLVGFLLENATITESYATGKIDGNRSAGGFMGFAGGVTGMVINISDSYAAVDVTIGGAARVDNVGQFVGKSVSNPTINVSNSWTASPSGANMRMVDNTTISGTVTNVYAPFQVSGGVANKGADAYNQFQANLPTGFTAVTWGKVDNNWPYLINNADSYLNRTKAFVAAPTTFKYTKKTNGAGVDTMALAFGLTTKVGLSGYELLTAANLFNIDSTNSAYDAGKNVTFVITDTAAAQPALNTTETIATTNVGGSTKQRVGLSNLDGVVVSGYNQTAMSAYDTVALMGSYYGAPILTGATGTAAATLPIGIDALGVYNHRDLIYMDELQTIFGNGKTYTMRNDIVMDNARVPTNELVDGEWSLI